MIDLLLLGYILGRVFQREVPAVVPPVEEYALPPGYEWYYAVEAVEAVPVPYVAPAAPTTVSLTLVDASGVSFTVTGYSAPYGDATIPITDAYGNRAYFTSTEADQIWTRMTQYVAPAPVVAPTVVAPEVAYAPPPEYVAPTAVVVEQIPIAPSVAVTTPPAPLAVPTLSVVYNAEAAQAGYYGIYTFSWSGFPSPDWRDWESGDALILSFYDTATGAKITETALRPTGSSGSNQVILSSGIPDAYIGKTIRVTAQNYGRLPSLYWGYWGAIAETTFTYRGL